MIYKKKYLDLKNIYNEIKRGGHGKQWDVNDVFQTKYVEQSFPIRGQNISKNTKIFDELINRKDDVFIHSLIGAYILYDYNILENLYDYLFKNKSKDEFKDSFRLIDLLFHRIIDKVNIILSPRDTIKYIFYIPIQIYAKLYTFVLEYKLRLMDNTLEKFMKSKDIKKVIKDILLPNFNLAIQIKSENRNVLSKDDIDELNMNSYIEYSCKWPYLAGFNNNIKNLIVHIASILNSKNIESIQVCLLIINVLVNFMFLKKEDVIVFENTIYENEYIKEKVSLEPYSSKTFFDTIQTVLFKRSIPYLYSSNFQRITISGEELRFNNCNEKNFNMFLLFCADTVKLRSCFVEYQNMSTYMNNLNNLDGDGMFSKMISNINGVFYAKNVNDPTSKDEFVCFNLDILIKKKDSKDIEILSKKKTLMSYMYEISLNLHSLIFILNMFLEDPLLLKSEKLFLDPLYSLDELRKILETKYFLKINNYEELTATISKLIVEIKKEDDRISIYFEGDDYIELEIYSQKGEKLFSWHLHVFIPSHSNIHLYRPYNINVFDYIL